MRDRCSQGPSPSVTASASNLEKLSAFQQTGVTEFTFIEQGGTNAEAIKKTLQRINLPPGFKIGLYAVVPDARHMAVGPQGIVTIVGTRKTKVWSVTDRNKNRVADEVKDFAPSLSFAIPNGPCFSKDGFLYIAEQNRVLVFPAAEFFYESPDVAAFNVIKKGALVPPAEESYNHTARVCRIGPDGMLYISLGQPFNVAPAEKLELYKQQMQKDRMIASLPSRAWRDRQGRVLARGRMIDYVKGKIQATADELSKEREAAADLLG